MVDGDLVELGGPGLRLRGHRDHAIARGGRRDRQCDGHRCQPEYQANAAPHRRPLLHPWRGQPIAWLLLLALCVPLRDGRWVQLGTRGRALAVAPGRAAGVGVGGGAGLAAVPGWSRAGKPDRLAALMADRLAAGLLPLLQSLLVRRRGVALGWDGG